MLFRSLYTTIPSEILIDGAVKNNSELDSINCYNRNPNDLHYSINFTPNRIEFPEFFEELVITIHIVYKILPFIKNPPETFKQIYIMKENNMFYDLYRYRYELEYIDFSKVSIEYITSLIHDFNIKYPNINVIIIDDDNVDTVKESFTRKYIF